MHFDWKEVLLLLRLALDILFVWMLVYAGIRIIRNNNRTIQILKGLIAVFLLKLLAMTLNLQGANFLIGIFLNWGVILVMIILQPEIRGMLEKMGKSNTFFSSSIPAARTAAMIDELMTAVENMSRSKTGALITLQMNQSMQDYEETGIPMDSDVSSELLETIFQYGTPMHDGAVIIEGDKIATAAAYYPSTSRDLPSKYGARHRAAVGISEATDSITLVVSEETGNISVANRGVLTQYSPQALRRFLTNKLIPEETTENTSVLTPVINTVRSYSNQLLPNKGQTSSSSQKPRSDDRVKPIEVVDMRPESAKKDHSGDGSSDRRTGHENPAAAHKKELAEKAARQSQAAGKETKESRSSKDKAKQARPRRALRKNIVNQAGFTAGKNAVAPAAAVGPEAENTEFMPLVSQAETLSYPQPALDQPDQQTKIAEIPSAKASEKDHESKQESSKNSASSQNDQLKQDQKPEQADKPDAAKMAESAKESGHSKQEADLPAKEANRPEQETVQSVKETGHPAKAGDLPVKNKDQRSSDSAVKDKSPMNSDINDAKMDRRDHDEMISEDINALPPDFMDQPYQKESRLSKKELDMNHFRHFGMEKPEKREPIDILETRNAGISQGMGILNEAWYKEVPEAFSQEDLSESAKDTDDDVHQEDSRHDLLHLSDDQTDQNGASTAKTESAQAESVKKEDDHAR